MASCFWGHEWSDWEIADKGPLVDSGATHPEMKDWTVGYFLRQERCCRRCKFVELSIQRIYLDSAEEMRARIDEARVRAFEKLAG